MMNSMAVAVDMDGAMGDSESRGLPWSFRTDLELFRRLTWGADCIVGRKTYEQLPESVRSCPGRRWYVVSDSIDEFKHAENTLDGFEFVRGDHIVFCGGKSIYEQSFDLVDRIFLSRLPCRSGGDIIWPGVPEEFECVRDRRLPDNTIVEEYA